MNVIFLFILLFISVSGANVWAQKIELRTGASVGIPLASTYAAKTNALLHIPLDLHYLLNKKIRLGIETGLLFYASNSPTLSGDVFISYTPRVRYYSVPFAAKLEYNFIDKKLTPFIGLSAGGSYTRMYENDLLVDSQSNIAPYFGVQFGLKYKLTKKFGVCYQTRVINYLPISPNYRAFLSIGLGAFVQI